MTKDNELILTTTKYGQVYLECGWYTYDELKEILKCNKKVEKELFKLITPVKDKE